MQKLIINKWEIMIRIKNHPILKYWDVNNLYGLAMSPKLPINGFEWVEDTSQFYEDFMKSHNEESEKGYFLGVDIQYLENLHNLYNDLPFLPERMKIEKVEKVIANLHEETEYVIHIRKLRIEH